MQTMKGFCAQGDIFYHMALVTLVHRPACCIFCKAVVVASLQRNSHTLQREFISYDERVFVCLPQCKYINSNMFQCFKMPNISQSHSQMRVKGVTGVSTHGVQGCNTVPHGCQGDETGYAAGPLTYPPSAGHAAFCSTGVSACSRQ